MSDTRDTRQAWERDIDECLDMLRDEENIFTTEQLRQRFLVAVGAVLTTLVGKALIVAAVSEHEDYQRRLKNARPGYPLGPRERQPGDPR